ncbi:kinase, putative [Medicago truncatula]|uniref:Kinase, putative n=1 Tax=Medicago truncatula TaxID=3880 RepID=G7L2Z0_MEDTR|nr:kinase, putative [Medicago truncatula]
MLMMEKLESNSVPTVRNLVFRSWKHLLTIDENVAKEIINHRSLRDPNIYNFICWIVSIQLERLERICNAGRFSELDEVTSMGYKKLQPISNLLLAV